MREVSVNQLERQTSKVVRAVREENAGYEITLGAKPVAMIVSFRSPPEKQELSLEAFWAEMDWLAQEMEESTPPGAKTALQQLFEDREARMRSPSGEDRDA